ncbi:MULTISPECIES: transporter substrate-binding domain-containing protein [unclassified Pseudomonas]|uniref:transporter substrate-binding domain-containing protein n=1 Tax=unclassified Pseudomonas TaxID=196821 RepID=UPI000BC3CE61|nr:MULTISPECIES: transporter substrate-binding domain-containing protein [unclassified Pseudomonas]PVZ10337.1 polar amino acid transport system substrate-binding protein [Pseudomonas sp. URIL14HWK12:I12]PVZ21763.1 polar amino acid transport system substrate-binding protein [Pseudomonas sp. URIL14HWK12:I10]PVZ31154.1 polar amino acid transport system substrate-binding protein [Pseudomonas sp. URIL14HWK12:I11]SNZ17893.1 amino acid ABC transporter substrate-binding protein, PAAT family (TC 3.A.1.3
MYRMITFCLAAVLAAGSAQAAEKLRMGIDGSHPPFNNVDASGQVVGFDADLGAALCAKMKVECEIVTTPTDQLLPALNDNRFDFVMSSMSITPERKEIADFTDPYYINRLQFVAPDASDVTNDPATLMGKHLGAQHDTLSSAWLEANAAQVADVQLFEDQDQLYNALATGQIDAALTDKYATYEWLRTDAGKGFSLKGDPVENSDQIGMAVRLNDPLRARLNLALKDVIADGTFKRLNDKYFPFSIR